VIHNIETNFSQYIFTAANNICYIDGLADLVLLKTH
jgi:hypothetical protein